MKKELDFSGISTFEQIKAGGYKFKIIDVEEFQRTKQTNLEQVKITFENKEKQRHYEIFQIEGKAVFKLQILLKACGFDVSGQNFIFDSDKLIGKKFLGTLKKKFYMNEERGLEFDLREFTAFIEENGAEIGIEDLPY